MINFKVIEQGKEKLIFTSFVKFPSKTRLKDLKIWFRVRFFFMFLFLKRRNINIYDLFWYNYNFYANIL